MQLVFKQYCKNNIGISSKNYSLISVTLKYSLLSLEFIFFFLHLKLFYLFLKINQFISYGWKMTLKYIVIEEIYLLYYIALRIVKNVIKYYLNNIIKYNFRCYINI